MHYLKAWKNGTLPIGNTQMDYIAFGRGRKPLIVLPGLGDGLKSAKGTALPFSVMYHKLGADYRVFFFSRRRSIPDGFTTKDMAEDVVYAMDVLHIRKAYVLGVSMGGMISQHLAITHPERVAKLVLCVTTVKMGDQTQRIIRRWEAMARRKKYRAFMLDMGERIYTEACFKKRKMLYHLMGNIAVPKSWDNYYAQTAACLTHDTSNDIHHIKCPTLILGGEQDHVIPMEDSKKLTEAIPGSRIYLYPLFGHGVPEEARDFQERLISFFG